LLLASVVAAQTIPVEFPATRVTIPKRTVEAILPQPPTAAELSKPNALADYIDATLRKGERVQLPGGVIKTQPIKLNSHGGVIQGVGMPCHPHDSATGWRSDNVAQGVTYLVPDGDSIEPLITLDKCEGVRLQDLGIQTKGVGVHLTAQRGWGNFHTLLDRVAFHSCEIGFNAGQTATDPNGADVEFRTCLWKRNATCVRVNHSQGVNFDFYGQSRAEYCGTFLHHAHGGICRVDGLTAFGLKTVLKVDSGGGNLCPLWVGRLYLDREPNHPPTCIVDASDATGAVRVLVDGYHVSGKASDYTMAQDGSRVWKWADHQYVVRPLNKTVDRDSVIVVRNPELNGYAGGVRP
jgi:hypothetical protein